jgi:hypothetical protein
LVTISRIRGNFCGVAVTDLAVIGMIGDALEMMPLVFRRPLHRDQIKEVAGIRRLNSFALGQPGMVR